MTNYNPFEEFSSKNTPELGKKLLEKIQEVADEIKKDVSIMHICGTHEYTIAKSGIRELLPKNVRVIPGPGCPVCVCPTSDIDLGIEIARQPNVILTTFGDMMRVPSTTTTFYEEKAKGSDIRVVYGPNEAVELAKNNPDKEVVFFSIGFETTVPLPAVQIANNPPNNFSIISAHKIVPPAMDLLLTHPDMSLDGFLLPGHVLTIIGMEPFKPYASEYTSPMVVGGFDPNDVLISLYRLLVQIKNGEGKVENTYSRIARDEGNIAAQEYIEKVFEPCDSIWRGIGNVPNSGLKLRKEYEKYDARIKFDVEIPVHQGMPKGCSCDAVLIGKIPTQECHLFGGGCTPRNPIGPCMVSHEGSCKIAFLFQKMHGN